MLLALTLAVLLSAASASITEGKLAQDDAASSPKRLSLKDNEDSNLRGEFENFQWNIRNEIEYLTYRLAKIENITYDLNNNFRDFVKSELRNLKEQGSQSGEEIVSCEEKSFEDLVAATISDDTQAIKSLLSCGDAQDWVAQYDRTYTLLHYAQSEAAVQQLVAAGAPLEAPHNYTRYTPLIWAAKNSSSAAAQELIHQGADVSANATNNETALLWAVKNADFPLAKLLVEHGADVEARTDYPGDTPLHKISSNGSSLDIFHLLVDNGADVNSRNAYGATPLYQVSGKCVTDVAEEIINTQVVERGRHLTRTSSSERTALFAAARAGCIPILNMLLATTPGRAELNNQDSYGYTALLAAVESGNTEVVRILLENSADITLADNYGYTAVLMAAYMNRLDLVQMLVERGADLSVTTSSGRTVLRLARTSEMRAWLEKYMGVDS